MRQPSFTSSVSSTDTRSGDSVDGGRSRVKSKTSTLEITGLNRENMAPGVPSADPIAIKSKSDVLILGYLSLSSHL